MTPEEQAGAWCTRLAFGNLSSAEQTEFDDWISSSPSNGELLDRVLVAWRGLSRISESPEIIWYRADALDALRRANRKRWSRKLVMRWQWGAGLAAALVLSVFAFAWAVRVQPEVYATGLGERRIVVLTDGSRLSLDANSTVSVLYRKKERDLTLLSGRAKFDVARNPDRPFRVTAGGRTTVATGTEFSVELLRGKMHVVLYEGRVKVIKSERDASGGAIALVPGQELVTDISPAAVPVVERIDSFGSLAWENGQLVFADEPLAAAVEQLNRYSRIKMIVGDGHAAKIRINGVFNAGDSEAFLDAIAQIHDVRLVTNDDRTVILSKKVIN